MNVKIVYLFLTFALGLFWTGVLSAIWWLAGVV
jgi:hypothetical protein